MSQNKIVALLTDFGLQDVYVGARERASRDLRRTAVVHNLHVLVRLLKDDPELFASK